MVGKTGLRFWGKLLFCSLGEIFGIMFSEKGTEDIDGPNIVKHGITVDGGHLSMVV